VNWKGRENEGNEKEGEIKREGQKKRKGKTKGKGKENRRKTKR
jgi:hypothetical protein